MPLNKKGKRRGLKLLKENGEKRKNGNTARRKGSNRYTSAKTKKSKKIEIALYLTAFPPY